MLIYQFKKKLAVEKPYHYVFIVNALLHKGITLIYPGTIRKLSTSTRTQAQQSISKRTQALNRSMPNQWARSQLVCFNEDQLSMPQALNRLMPNQWARSQLSISTRTSYHCHKLLIDQCQTNGHDLSSYVSTRTSYHCHKLLIDQYQTNGHDPSFQCQRGPAIIVTSS